MKLKYKGKTVLYKNVAKKIAKPLGAATKAAGIALGVSTVGVPTVAGLLAADLAMNYVDKKAGQKLGKYKSYRLAREATKFGSKMSKGNIIGAMQESSKMYGDLDPSQRRRDKFKKFNVNYLAPTLQLAGAGKQASSMSTRIEKAM